MAYRRNKQPKIFALIIAMVAIVGYLFAMFPEIILGAEAAKNSLFFNIIDTSIETKFRLVLIATHVGLAFLFQHFFAKFLLSEERTWIPFWLYLFFIASSFSSLSFSLLIIAPLFTTIILYLGSFNEAQKGGETQRAFNVMALISIVSIFELELLFLIPLVWFQDIIYKEFSFKSLMAGILGILTPFWTYYGVKFFIKGAWELPDFTVIFSSNYQLLKQNHGVYLFFLSAIILLFLAGTAFIFQRFPTFNQTKRRILSITIMFFFYLLALGLLNILDVRLIYMLIVPLLSLVVSSYLSNTSNTKIWIYYVVLYLLFLISFIKQI